MNGFTRNLVYCIQLQHLQKLPDTSEIHLSSQLKQSCKNLLITCMKLTCKIMSFLVWFLQETFTFLVKARNMSAFLQVSCKTCRMSYKDNLQDYCSRCKKNVMQDLPSKHTRNLQVLNKFTSANLAHNSLSFLQLIVSFTASYKQL